MQIYSRWLVVLAGVCLLSPPSNALLITINPSEGLAGNEQALAAFNRAADTWESVFTDPIEVNIDADLLDLGSTSVIGQASSVLLQAGFDLIRDAIVADALDEFDDWIVNFLPTAAQFSAFIPTGYGVQNLIVATKANLKAMGFTGLDDLFGATDATIQFNSTFAFDFDNRDGVASNQIDFETTALHEIGHALGFISVVDTIDSALQQGVTGNVSINPLDLFRFQADSNPASTDDFTTFARSLTPGAPAFFDDLDIELLLSTGRFNGDGRQASHWRDDALSGIFIGAMDPTLAAGTIFPLTAYDVRALDVIGYDTIPEPETFLLFGLGLLALGWSRWCPGWSRKG